MKLKTLVITTVLTSFVFTSLCQADGLPTGKRQHKLTTATKPIDKATPASPNSSLSDAKTDSNKNVRAAYRLCPDGSMIHPGEKCPEKDARK